MHPRPFPLQMAGRRGGPAPKVEKIVKEGHVAWTACGPAEGPMMSPLWTFAGERSVKSLAKGAPDAVWQKTSNGWPDVETVRVFAEMLVAEKKKRNLARILLLSDNADIHTDLEVISLFRKNSIKHVGLIHGASSYHQPLGRGFFDMVKGKIGAFAQKNDITLCYDNIAGVLHNVLAELEEAARKRGSSVLRRGFADTGLHPFNPAVQAKGDRGRGKGKAARGEEKRQGRQNRRKGGGKGGPKEGGGGAFGAGGRAGRAEGGGGRAGQGKKARARRGRRPVREGI